MTETTCKESTPKYTHAELCCIAISQVENITSKRALAILSLFENEKDFISFQNKTPEIKKLLDTETYNKLMQSIYKPNNEKFLQSLEIQNIKALTRFSKLYPKSLEHLEDPPLVLYCKGNVDLLTKPAVAIVGTRDCTRYGTDVAKRFAKQFAENGVVTISGLADGIDTAAHTGAIAASKDNSLTIAVLGNGVNYNYPKSNAALQTQIAEKGLILSEYLPNAPSQKFHFPYRNRIIAALSKATIIVEADIKSGALITKDYALDLGREVFAVPGPITSYASRGTNEMIKTAACSIVTDCSDVMEIFGVTAQSEEEHTVIQISYEAGVVLDALKGEEVHFDELMKATKFPVKKLGILLTNMELDGLIVKLAGNYYAARSKK